MVTQPPFLLSHFFADFDMALCSAQLSSKFLMLENKKQIKDSFHKHFKALYQMERLYTLVSQISQNFQGLPAMEIPVLILGVYLACQGR